MSAEVSNGLAQHTWAAAMQPADSCPVTGIWMRLLCYLAAVPQSRLRLACWQLQLVGKCLRVAGNSTNLP